MLDGFLCGSAGFFRSHSLDDYVGPLLTKAAKRPEAAAHDFVTWIQDEVVGIEGSQWLPVIQDIHVEARQRVLRIPAEFSFGSGDVVLAFSTFPSVAAALIRKIGRRFDLKREDTALSLRWQSLFGWMRESHHWPEYLSGITALTVDGSEYSFREAPSVAGKDFRNYLPAEHLSIQSMVFTKEEMTVAASANFTLQVDPPDVNLGRVQEFLTTFITSYRDFIGPGLNRTAD